ncbi:MAG: tRNA-dihydrouridine synthase family protein, partial [Lachnospiraceae bacterium]|nr:tRNA-dihydrouridine synthase family protein [Lachnospiraceae bacterium]
MSFRIGNVTIDNEVALGPMAGVTDLPFRLLCREQGAGLLYTEMVSAKGVLYHNRNTTELLETCEAEDPIALQLFGSDPQIMAEQAKVLEELPFVCFDINMGCPVPKVVNNGEGSALMKDPKLVYEIVNAMVRAQKKPVTVKIRKGFTEDNAVEVAKACEAAGASAVAVHGRLRGEYYGGKADWDCIRRVKEAVSVPVIGSGDVDSAEKALRMKAETGVDAV